MKIDLRLPDMAALDKLNTTALKSLLFITAVAMTALVWAVCTLGGIPIDNATLALWLTFLTALGGIGAYTQKNYRETDYEYARIKAGANVPASTTTVQAGAVNVAAAQTTTEEAK